MNIARPPTCTGNQVANTYENGYRFCEAKKTKMPNTGVWHLA